jgi:hypothetical protein
MDSSCFRRLPPGMTQDQVLGDLLFLSELIDMNESNATKLGRLQSLLDINNITATAALEEVRSTMSIPVAARSKA